VAADERKMNIIFGIRSRGRAYKCTQGWKRTDITKEMIMKKTVLAITATALLITGFASSAVAQERYYREKAPAIYFDDGELDGYAVQERRYYDGESRRYYRDERRERFGPRDVARMLERRGYRVRDVDYERGRYFVRASRRGNPVLVVVSRDGEILETRRAGGDRYRDRQESGFRIEINPAY